MGKGEAGVLNRDGAFWRSACIGYLLVLALVSAGPATADPVLDQARQGAVAVSPAEALAPKAGTPRAYRESTFANCSAFPGVCRHAFDRVPNRKLLEVANVSCVALMPKDVEPGNFFLSKSPNADKILNHLVAIIPAARVWERGTLTDRVANASGPYFFKAGERPFVFVSGSPEGAASCALSGHLWDAN